MPILISFDTYFDGCRFTHGTPFRRAIEEGLLDPKRVVQIGIRGTMYDGGDIEWGREQGVTIITMDEFADRSIKDVMDQARQIVGQDRLMSALILIVSILLLPREQVRLKLAALPQEKHSFW